MKKQERRQSFTLPARVKRLCRKSFRMVWDVHDYLFEKNYAALLDYYRENGNADVPSYYVTADGLALGRWIRYQIDVGEKLPEKKKEKLLALGVSFEKTDAWDVKFALLKQYYAEHGDLKIPANYVVNGVWLARWLTEQKARLNGKSTGRSGKKHLRMSRRLNCTRLAFREKLWLDG